MIEREHHNDPTAPVRAFVLEPLVPLNGRQQVLRRCLFEILGTDPIDLNRFTGLLHEGVSQLD